MLNHDRTVEAISNSQFNGVGLGTLVSGARDDVPARAFEPPERLNVLRVCGVAGQVLMAPARGKLILRE